MQAVDKILCHARGILCPAGRFGIRGFYNDYASIEFFFV